ncbi:MAG: XRE family transcriptional regulator [Candidatus Omnitrophica bacterium]|nr:XRE family transcriptional regulator [Candidatus Omnitrophota bacterium]MBI3021429.1 XRE family transcriptional regulator [Candidatus Omnitrophota bacterium]MBI3084062.1 XRE family transcriptional regulator [Candidatus Omnitrophota bacterium]
MKRMRLTTHKQVLRTFLRDPQFRQGYEEELDKLRLVEALVGLRQRQGLTQAALAKRLKVSQPFIAKLERAETHNFTLDTLLKVVEALNGELVIKIRQRAPRYAHA